MRSMIELEGDNVSADRKIRVVPMHRCHHAPVEPLDCFACMGADSKYSFLLESVERDNTTARYSFLGVETLFLG